MKKMNKVLHLICTAIVMFLLTSCTFDGSGLPSGLIYSSAETVKPTKEQGDEILKDELYIYHGYQCTESRNGKPVRLNKEFPLPTGAYNYDDAFVFLNGWKFRFLHDDTEIVGIGVSIDNLELGKNSLKWSTIGVIGDEDFEEAYEFCYQYTLIAMTKKFKGTEYITDSKSSSWDHVDQNTALLSVPRFIHSSKFEEHDSVEILPRGFGIMWSDKDEDYFLQFAYRLGIGERYIYGPHKAYSGKYYSQRPKLPQQNSSTTIDFANKDFSSWESSVIFKNGDSPDEFTFAEQVLGLGSNKFSMIEPHFSVQPINQRSGFFQQDPDVEEIVVKNVPYQFAIPVLKGWDLRFEKDDEDVREVGIWIDSFSFKKGPTLVGGARGTLTYKVKYVLRDDDGNASNRTFGVSILGTNNIWPD